MINFHILGDTGRQFRWFFCDAYFLPLVIAAIFSIGLLRNKYENYIDYRSVLGAVHEYDIHFVYNFHVFLFLDVRKLPGTTFSKNRDCADIFLPRCVVKQM